MGMNFKQYIRVIEDFPQPGISFKDITTLLKNGPVYQQAIDHLVNRIKELNIDLIAGPEARGFVVGAPLAYALGVGFVPIRKSGKLPAEAVEADYDLEYGQDRLAMHKDAFQPGQRVLIADDLLATGGEVAGAAFFIELAFLNGRAKLPGIDIITLMKYE
jgi:adenine phosphoribosyltransferase